MGFSEEAARQPTVYGRFQPTYLQAQCLRGFPDYLPANALLTRACGQPIHRVSRPEYAEAAELTTRVPDEIVPVTSRYANVGETENLYRCKTCGSVWRLIEPDPPFSGLWELTANG